MLRSGRLAIRILLKIKQLNLHLLTLNRQIEPQRAKRKNPHRLHIQQFLK